VPDDKFRLPGSSYEQLARIIKAYSLMKGGVGPADVARPLGIDATIVSRNNGFLLGTQLVEGGNKKTLTDRGQALARALEYDVEEDVRASWREIVRDTDFLREIVDSVRIRDGMVPAALQSHIAYSARQPSNAHTRTGAGTVIEILRLAGAILEQDGKFVAQPFALTPDEERGETPTSSVSDDRDEPTPAVVAHSSHEGANQLAAPGVSVTLNVSIECTVDDLPRLGDKLVELDAKLRRLRDGDS
jgi:hypothetical protein